MARLAQYPPVGAGRKGDVVVGKMRLGEWLIHNRALSPEQVQTALAYARQWRCKLGDAILELRLIPREQFMRLLAGHLNVPFIRGDQLDKVPVATLHSVPAECSTVCGSAR